MATPPEPNTTGGGLWEPYSSFGDYFRHVPLHGQVAFVLLALVFAVGVPTTLIQAMHDLLCLVRRWRARVGQDSGSSSDPENVPPPPLVYSSAECAICLGEFADADAVRVMPACRHGFHAFCIELWLAGGRRSSCPTCRAPVAIATGAAAAEQPAR